MPWGRRLWHVPGLWIVLTVANCVALGIFLHLNGPIVGKIVESEVQYDAPRTESGAGALWNNNNTKVVGFADAKFKEVAVRWYRRLEDLGYSTHAVVTNDEEAALLFEKEGIRYDRLLDNRITKNVSDFHSCAYGDTQVKPSKQAQNYRRHLFASRWHYIARQLQYEKTHILMSDVDNIFNRYQDMAEWENSPYDAYHSFEGLVPSFPRNYFRLQGFTLCGALSWLRSTPTVIEFVKYLAAKCRCGNETFIDCQCRCDDQQVLNSMVLVDRSEYKIIWDRDNVTIPKTWDEQSWDSVTGTCQKTGHRVKVWGRHTVWRGQIDRNRCPLNNWVSMPSAISDKKSMVEQWDIACGTGRGNKTGEVPKLVL